MSDTQTMDEFLGAPSRGRWKRLALIIVPGIVLLLIALVVVKVTSGGDGPGYVTQDVTTGSLDITVTATGNLRPTNQVDVGSEVSGKIDYVYVDVNDRVTRGQVLARINTDVIENDITRSRANLNSSLANVERAKATLQYDQAQLDRLKQVYELSGGKVPSKSELEVAEANVTRDKAALAAEQASVVSSRASLSSSETQRSRAIIRSPVSGVVLARQVEPGQTVAASFNTPTLFVLAEDLSAMQLRVSVDEADVGNVLPNQKASFTVDAYPGREFPASVERVNLGSNNTTTQAQGQANAVVVYEARLTVANPEGLLRPGMTATANIATESTGSGLLVPNSALRFRPPEASDGGAQFVNNGNNATLERREQQATIGVGSRQTVFVLKDDGKLESVSVVTGRSDGRLTLVTSKDLKKGMKVVTSLKADKK